MREHARTVIAVGFLALAAWANPGTAAHAATGPESAVGQSAIVLQELAPGVCTPVLFEARNPGYTGAGYINPPEDVAARVRWTISSPQGGRHAIGLRFANGGATARSGVLVVNDQAASGRREAFHPTGAWSDWKVANFSVDLAPGQNTLELRATADAALPNVDSLTVTGPGPAAGACEKPNHVASASTDLSHLDAGPLGWVTQNGGVTGGGDLAPRVATTMDELQALAGGIDPRVIHIRGTIEGALTVGSNKTIIGLPGAELRNDTAVLRFTGSRNVIFRNVTVVGGPGRNRHNTVLHDARNVWLDHNTFINGGPDLVLVAGSSNYVTLSWNVFQYSVFAHEHAAVNIGGSDDDDVTEDSAGRLRVTLHHNYFADLVNERMPRVRFGQVHTFNNVADAGVDPLTRSYYAVRAGVDANIRSERNVYRNFEGPSWWWTSDKLGADRTTVFNYARGNANSVLESIEDVCTPGCVEGPITIREQGGLTGSGGFYSVGKAFIPPYAYSLEPTEGLEARIRAGAGAR